MGEIMRKRQKKSRKKGIACPGAYRRWLKYCKETAKILPIVPEPITAIYNNG